MYTFMAGGKTVSVFPSDAPGAPVLCLNTFPDEGQRVLQAAQQAGCPPFTLVAVSGLEWNRDMAPWDSPAIFKNAAPCTGGADDYLRLLVETILPEAESKIHGTPRWRGIVGYSLAGLFAVYAVYRTDVFSRVASVSGSLWFPGMKEYAFSHAFKRQADCAYFSLGDREHKARSPVLQSVRQNTQEIQTLWQEKQIQTVFRLNPGNHYSHGTERTAAGIQWLLEQGG